MGEVKRKQELTGRFLAEIENWRQPIAFEMHIIDTINLIGFLQLSLRHPSAAKTKSAVNVRDFIKSFTDSLPPENTAIREVIAQGYDVSFDTRFNPKAKCRVCGCTEEKACPGGCHWVQSDLCSACAPAANSIITP